jgi:hypothetical protein
MANANPTAETLLAFAMDNHPELVDTLETPEGVSEVLELYHASLSGGDAGEKVRKPREAREVIVLLVRAGEPTAYVVGSGFTAGRRESADPSEWSEAKRLESKGRILAAKAAKNLPGPVSGKGWTVMVAPIPEGF